MAHKPKRPLHPLRMVEGIEAMAFAATMFAARVDAVASLMEPSALSKELKDAGEAFHTAFWPEDRQP